MQTNSHEKLIEGNADRGPFIRFFLGCGSSFLLLSLGWLHCSHYYLRTTPDSIRTLRYLMAKKLEAIRQTTPPRLVIVSASSSMMGLRSEEMERKLKIPVINFGLPFDFGARGILDLAKREMRSGDTILLALEYGFFGKARVASADHLALLVLTPSFFEELPFFDRVRAILAITPDLALKRTPWGRRRWDGDFRVGRYHYPLGMATPRGELICDESSGMQRYAQVVAEGPPDPFLLEGVPSEKENWNDLRSFISSAKLRGVHLLASYPPLYRHRDYEGQELKLVSQMEDFYRREEVDLIGSARAEMVEKEDICDDSYHVTAQAAFRRSARLADALSSHLNGAERIISSERKP